MALEKLGAGFGRTGTYSLKTALERLGFGPCHHMSEVIGEPTQIDLWSGVANGRADFDRIFFGFRAPVDFPESAYRQDVRAISPGSRVILSHRDAEDWYNSFLQTILPLILNRDAWSTELRSWFKMIESVIIGKALGGHTDRDGVIAAYRANEAAARDFGAQGDALVFDVRDGW